MHTNNCILDYVFDPYNIKTPPTLCIYVKHLVKKQNGSSEVPLKRDITEEPAIVSSPWLSDQGDPMRLKVSMVRYFMLCEVFEKCK
jgi:hypothetical protein